MPETINWRELLRERTDLDIPEDKVEISVRCPFHDDRHPSLSINFSKQVFFCHTCNEGGSLKTFIIRYLDDEKISSIISRYIEEALILNFDFKEKEDISDILPEVDYPFKGTMYPIWILERDFNRKSLVKWEFGKSESGSLSIPIRDEHHRIVGWVCRQPQGRFPKYVYSKGLKTSKILFGEYNISKEAEKICITEGPLDTVWLDQHGFSSVALFGLNLSKFQEKRLSILGIGEFILCLDNDAPGQKALEVISNKLSRYGIVTRIEIPDGYKDVQDIRDRKLLKNVIENRVLFKEKK